MYAYTKYKPALRRPESICMYVCMYVRMKVCNVVLCMYVVVCWAVMSELVPTRVRSKAMSLFLSVNWATNLLVAFLTLTAIDGLGQVRSDMNDDQTAAAEKKGTLT